MSFVDRPSPHWSSRGIYVPEMVVIHADAGQTEEGTLSWLEHPDSKVSYHWLVGRDGKVYRIVPEVEKAWHAGESSWPGITVGNSVNPRAIGVAFANNGTEAYREAQYVAGAELVADAMERYSIPLGLVRGHNEVSPGRKTDPYPQFNWRTFYGWLGMQAAGRAA